MLDLGLKPSEHRQFMEAMQGTHDARTQVEILDRDEHIMREIDISVVSGAVDVDETQPVSRSLTLELADPDHRFNFAPDAPGDFALFADNFIRVKRGVYVPAMSRWVDVPLFTGPISKIERGGHSITITGIGKEALGLEPAFAWRPLHIPKGHLVVDAIHDVLAHMGERRFDFPKSKLRTKKKISLGRTSEAWKVANRLAVSIDRQLFYDGRGRARLRAHPKHAQFHFVYGENGNVTSRPVTTYDIERVRNTVQVLGPEPEGHAERVRFVAYAEKGHPLSPWRLARNGEPRYLVETVDAEHVKRTEQAKHQAERKLDELLRGEIDQSFEAIPILGLEPGDSVALNDDGELSHIRLRKFSIPVIGGAMSVGNLRRVGVRKG